MNFIIHRNKWIWGDSIYIITEDAMGTVTVQFDAANKKAGYITCLSVKEEARKKGYGVALIKEAEKEIKERKCKYAMLTCMRKSWIADWYQSLGYKEDKSIILDYPDDMLALKKSIK